MLDVLAVLSTALCCMIMARSYPCRLLFRSAQATAVAAPPGADRSTPSHRQGGGLITVLKAT